jgi:hypothetical protein
MNFMKSAASRGSKNENPENQEKQVAWSYSNSFGTVCFADSNKHF